MLSLREVPRERGLRQVAGLHEARGRDASGACATVSGEFIRVLQVPLDVRATRDVFFADSTASYNWDTLRTRRGARQQGAIQLFNKIQLIGGDVAWAIALYENGKRGCSSVVALMVIPCDDGDVDLARLHQALGVPTAAAELAEYTLFKGDTSFAYGHKKFYCDPMPASQTVLAVPASRAGSTDSPHSSSTSDDGSPPAPAPAPAYKGLVLGGTFVAGANSSTLVAKLNDPITLVKITDEVLSGQPPLEQRL